MNSAPLDVPRHFPMTTESAAGVTRIHAAANSGVVDGPWMAANDIRCRQRIPFAGERHTFVLNHSAARTPWGTPGSRRWTDIGEQRVMGRPTPLLGRTKRSRLQAGIVTGESGPRWLPGLAERKGNGPQQRHAGHWRQAMLGTVCACIPAIVHLRRRKRPTSALNPRGA